MTFANYKQDQPGRTLGIQLHCGPRVVFLFLFLGVWTLQWAWPR